MVEVRDAISICYVWQTRRKMERNRIRPRRLCDNGRCVNAETRREVCCAGDMREKINVGWGRERD